MEYKNTLKIQHFFKEFGNQVKLKKYKNGSYEYKGLTEIYQILEVEDNYFQIVNNIANLIDKTLKKPTKENIIDVLNIGKFLLKNEEMFEKTVLGDFLLKADEFGEYNEIDFEFFNDLNKVCQEKIFKFILENNEMIFEAFNEKNVNFLLEVDDYLIKFKNSKYSSDRYEYDYFDYVLNNNIHLLDKTFLNVFLKDEKKIDAIVATAINFFDIKTDHYSEWFLFKNINQTIFDLYYNINGFEKSNDFAIYEPLSPLILNPVIFNEFFKDNGHLKLDFIPHAIKTSVEILKNEDIIKTKKDQIIENLFKTIEVVNKSIYDKQSTYDNGKLSNLIFGIEAVVEKDGDLELGRIYDLIFISNLAQENSKKEKIFQTFKNKLIFEDLFSKTTTPILQLSLFVNMIKSDFLNEGEILKVLQNQKDLLKNNANNSFIFSCLQTSYTKHDKLKDLVELKDILNEKQINFDFSSFLNEQIENITGFKKQINETWLKKIMDNFKEYVPYEDVEDFKKHIKIINSFNEKEKSQSDLDMEISRKINKKDTEESTKKLLRKALNLIS